MVEKSLEDMGEHLVRAVADEHLVRRNTVAGGDRLAQTGRARIGVEAQAIGCRGDRRQDARRRPVGILVGIELDEAIRVWLLAGHVGRQAMDDRTPEAAHELQPNRLITTA